MINLKNVSFNYKGIKEKALNSINLEIKQGELVMLLGESGCGKTSITRLLNGLIPEFYEGDLKGEIYIDKQDISNLYISDLAHKVGSVFQDPKGQFFTTDTTSELAFGLENLGISTIEIKEKVDATIKELKLETLVDRSIFQLSGGEKQQIAIGSVYAFSPKIIVLDEPSANLDSVATFRLKETLKLLKASGYTIVVAEHKIYYLRNIFDKAIVLKNGEIIKAFERKEFLDMDTEELRENGLRTLELEKIAPYRKKNKKNNIAVNIEKLSFSYNKKNNIIKDLSLENSKGRSIRYY